MEAYLGNFNTTPLSCNGQEKIYSIKERDAVVMLSNKKYSGPAIIQKPLCSTIFIS